MRKKTVATLLALTAVIASLAILPRTPPGRAWLLGRLTSALDRAGVRVTYDTSAGNPWTGLALRDARVTAPGLSLSARTLTVHYFLPSLISGELPLSVSVSGVRGSVDAGRLAAGVGGAGSLPIRPRLQELTVSDASVSVQKVPYTIPSGAVSHVRVRQHGASLALQAQLSTADGNADVTGTLDLGALRFDGQVVSADVRLARHWFPGAVAGTVSGPIHAGRDGVRADLSLRGGGVDGIGLHPRDVHGRIELRYPLVRADLQGTVLGGDVSAQGVVNIAARHWTAHASGAPQLLAAARWLARASLPQGAALPLRGSATTTLDASGWTRVQVSGGADGSGSFAGLPLSDLQADYSYDTAAGVKVQATGNVAGGATLVTAATGPHATTIEATVQQMAPLPGQRVDLQAHLALAATGTTGSVHVVDHGTLLSRTVSLTLDGGVNRDGWQAAIRGRDGSGAAVNGAVSLAAGRLSGELRVDALEVPLLATPLTATLRADGALSALPLTLTLGSDGPVTVRAGPEVADADFGGTVHATLRGARLANVEARLGPLQAAGDIELAPLGGQLALSLAPVRIAGPVGARVSFERGRLAFVKGRLDPHGTLQLAQLAAGPVGVPSLALELAATAAAGGVMATSRDRRLQLELSDGRAHLAVRSFPLRLGAVDARADGTLAVPMTARPLSGMRSEMSLVADGATLTLHGSGGRLAAALRAPAGTTLGPVSLAQELSLAGTVSAPDRAADLQGRLGAVPLQARMSTTPQGVGARLSAGSDGRTLNVGVDAGGWQAHGSLDLGPVATALGLPLRGTLSADLQRGPAGYEGHARLDAGAPIEAGVELTGTGPALHAALTSSVLGRPVSIAGTLRPALSLSARVGPVGPIALVHGHLQGSGTVPTQDLGAGARLEPLAWKLQGTLSPLSVDLDLGGHGAAHLDRARGLLLAAALRLPIAYGGRHLTLALATAGGTPSVPSVGAPAVPLSGSLSALTLTGRLLSQDGQTLASAGGTPGSLRFDGSVPAALIGARLPSTLSPAGRVTFTGTARLSEPRRLDVSGAWQAAGATLAVAASASAAGADLTVHGAGISITAAPGSLGLSASQARLAPLFPGLPLAPVLDGTLSRHEGRYSGTLSLRADPLAAGGGTVRATLTGRNEQVDARVTGSLGPVAGQVTGAVLPAPSLHAELTAWGGAATAAADARGPWSSVSVGGTLATRPLNAAPWLTVPSQHVSFTLTPASGALSISGAGVAVTGSVGSLQGHVRIPVGALGTEGHLDLDVTGPLASPHVSGSVTGSALTGHLSGDPSAGVRLDGVAARASLARLLPVAGGALAGDVRVLATLHPSGTWQASADGALSGLGRHWPLYASVAGSGARYEGTVDLIPGATHATGPPAPAAPSTASPLARAHVSGSGASLTATVDLARVDYAQLAALLGVPLTLDAKGMLTVATEPLSASLHVDATGAVAGQPLSLTARAGTGALAVDAGYGALAVHLAGAGGGSPIEMRVTSAPAGVRLSGSLTTGRSPGLALQGTAAGMAATLQLSADPAARRGHLHAALGTASLRADLTPAQGGLDVTTQLAVPSGSLQPLGVGVGGTLAIDARAAAGTVVLRRLALDLSGGPAPLSLALSGPAYPRADLTGSLAAPAWTLAGAVTLAGPPTSLEAGLTLGAFKLVADSRGRRLARVSANGTARLTPFGQALTIAARSLSWTPDAGFRGTASLRMAGAPTVLRGPVAASLSGDGALAVTAAAGPAAAPWARLAANLSADPTGPQAWQGALHLHVPLATVAGLPGPAALDLDGTAALGGGLLRPSLSGPLSLSGSASATGTLAWHGGGGGITLSSPALSVDASLDRGAWRASAAVHALALQPFAPALRQGHVSFRAEVQGGAGSPPSGDLSALQLSVPGASVTGTATLRDGIRAALHVSADLSAMTLPGPPLQGLVRGPLVLAAADPKHLGDGTLIAQLDVARLGPRGAPAAVDGTLQVGGSPASPTVSATLQGSGEAHGQLDVSVAPAARRLDLHSTLSYRRIVTDLDVSLHDGAIQASGHAAVGSASVSVSTTTGGALDVQGAGALDGWRAALAASLATASLDGPLDGLGAGAHGQLQLSFGGRPWLQGRIRSAALAGVRLGDLTLSSRAAGAPLRLDGPHLRATLDPADLSWQATLDGQPLPGGPTLSGSASGRGANGSASLSVAGRLAGQPVALTLHAARTAGVVLSANGTLLGGALSANITHPAGAPWQGTVALDRASLAGAQGTLSGQLGDAPGGGPELVAHAELQGALAGTVALHASAHAARVEADLKGAVLGGGLTASGSLAPTLDLTLGSTDRAGADLGRVRLFVANAALRASGALRTGVGPALLTLVGGGRQAPVQVAVRLPAVPGLAFQGALPDQRPVGVVRTLAASGLTLQGIGKTHGALTLRASPGPGATLRSVTIDLATLALSADGTVSPGSASVQGTITLPDHLPVDDLGGVSMPYRATWQSGTLTLSAAGPIGSARATLATDAASGTLTAKLHTLGSSPGTASAALSFDPGGGPNGTVTLHDVNVSRAGLPGVSVNADLSLGSGALSGSIDVSAPHGGVHVSGRWGLAGLLPDALAPNAVRGGNAEARVSTFDVATLPTVHRLAPHLSGSVSGVVRLRNRVVVGELLAPDMQVAGTALPFDAQISGTLDSLQARVTLASSVATATLEPGVAKGLVQLRSFPAQVLAESATGPTDVRADVDGVLRFEIPYARPAAAYLRMATQRVTLERAGVTTSGDLSWVYNDGALSVLDAAFQGRGSWQAKGTVSASTLDFQLSAKDADFTPLLGLIPVFARYGVGASGSFSLDAQGSPANPEVSLDASGMEARVAGTHYRIRDALAALHGRSLTASARVIGVAPLGGTVVARGSAQLSLTPLRLTHTDFSFSGNADLPVVGTVTKLSGGITQQPGQPPRLALRGRLGNPFTVTGSLSPFDVRVKGDNLALQAKPLFITSSTVNADVRLKAGRAGLAIGGELDASEVHMNIGAPAAPTASGAPSPPAQTAHPDANASPGSQAGAADQQQAALAARQSVIFDNLRLKAPQRVLLDAGFGNAEAALDLTLTGTAASPKLDGSAHALRGTLTFAGRDFTIDKATASFQASHGVFPSLDVAAHTDFDKQRVLAGDTNLSFTAPRDSSTFQVTLTFSGQVQPSAHGPSPVKFDIQPTLTSNAMVQETTDTGTASPRPLSDSELLALVTLGRLGVTPQLAGQTGFGTAVAQSALNTAVDVLVVSELQNALSKALGIDVVQIQTTPLSNLLQNTGQPFGVAVRVGGYVTPKLFASYRLGNYSDTSGAFGFSNEVSLSYDLGPLNFALSGQLTFPYAGAAQQAVPELGVGLRYAFTHNLGLDAGIDLSNVRKQAHFGVSVHW